MSIRTPPPYQGPPRPPLPWALLANLLGALLILGCGTWALITLWTLDSRVGSLATAGTGLLAGLLLARQRSDG